jgi:hypothetical protein
MKVVPPGFLTEVAGRPSTHLCAAKRYTNPKATPFLEIALYFFPHKKLFII